MMSILNIAGYRFTALTDLSALKNEFTLFLQSLSIKGTLLLSHEGININLSGDESHIKTFQQWLKQDEKFTSISFHESHSHFITFKRLKIKIKREIITFRKANILPNKKRAQSLEPLKLKQWLDEKREFTLLDTRNDYEILLGHFKNATNLSLNDFCELPEKITSLNKDKPIVMYCTGGIRCEKAALYLNKVGFAQVYQLEGGILGYFKQIGGEHYEGNCFVFDERLAVDSNLIPIKNNSLATEKQ